VQAGAFLAQEVHGDDADAQVLGDGAFVEGVGLAGLVNSAMLRSSWRYAVVGVFAVAAVVTPPDPISMMSLALPICLLYFVSIWCVQLIELRRKKEDAAAES